ncbi:MAG: riboflavin synthase subunit alpha [Candidatus Thermoplasmatota archaeon]|nr:riboflavin synthase subunit alpha [Candidatus Thermoplasmatota archaeon]
MYTGIVAGTAPILSVEDEDGVRCFTVDLTGFDGNLEIGASVALDGVCMTVVAIDSGKVGFEAIDETLDRTTLAEKVIGDLLNVERSLRMGDELGGHLLSGHVMCTAEILDRAEVGEGMDLRVSMPDEARSYVLEKGYVAVDGMSLTVGRVEESGFDLHIIPETIRVTTIGQKSVGDKVNIEVDSQTQAIVDTLSRSMEASG